MMKTSQIITFAAGAFCGAICVLPFTDSSAPAQPSIATSGLVQAELDAVEPATQQDNANEPLEITRHEYSQESSDAESLAALESIRAEQAQRLAVLGSIKDEVTHRRDARLDRLTESLGLDDRQRQAADRLLQECFPIVHDPAAFAILNESEREVVGLSGEGVFAGHLKAQDEKRFAEALGRLLTPKQAGIFQQASMEARTNAIEAAVYRELATLQMQMDLTAEQKDAAFTALGRIAQLEHDGSEPETEIFAHRRQQRIDAMSTIFSDDQMAAYEQSISGTVFSATFVTGSEPDADRLTVFANPEAF